jgi:hypothetical protein
VREVIKSEVAYLADNNLGFSDPADTAVALRVAIRNAMNCYVTSGPNHAAQWVRHIGGLTQYYFNAINFGTNPRVHPEQPGFGEWLCKMEACCIRATDSVARSARGDLASHLMDLLSLCYGCMEQHGGEQRQGYEV